MFVLQDLLEMMDDHSATQSHGWLIRLCIWELKGCNDEIHAVHLHYGKKHF